MSDVYEQFSLEQRAAEAGRSVEFQRAFERGVARAESRIEEWRSGNARTMLEAHGATVIDVAPRSAQYLPGVPKVLGRGDRGRWAKETVAGRLGTVVSPDDPETEARERQAAEEFAKDYKFRYEREVTPLEARFAVRPRGGEAIMLSGDFDELRQVFAAADLELGMEVKSASAASQVTVVRDPSSQR